MLSVHETYELCREMHTLFEFLVSCMHYQQVASGIFHTISNSPKPHTKHTAESPQHASINEQVQCDKCGHHLLAFLSAFTSMQTSKSSTQSNRVQTVH